MSFLSGNVSETSVEYEFMTENQFNILKCSDDCKQKKSAKEAVVCAVKCVVDPKNMDSKDLEFLNCSDTCIQKDNAEDAVNCVMNTCVLKYDDMEQKNYDGYSFF